MKLATIPKCDEKKKSFELFIDGEYAFSVDEEDYIRLQLYDKDEISPEELSEIRLQVEVNSGISSGIKYALRQKRTRKQVEEYLLENKLSHIATEKVIQYLEQEKYIDDTDYANRYMRGRIKTTDKSMYLILTELKQRGIPDETTSHLSEEYESLEFDRAYSSVLKRFGSLKRQNAFDLPNEEMNHEDPFGSESMSFQEKQKMKAKAVRFLLYRGYQQDIISQVINKTGL